MNSLAEFLRIFCASLEVTSSEVADETFANTNGRDDFGPRLTSWLNRSQDAFPFAISAIDMDHVTDRGVDVLLKAVSPGEQVAFQIKSNNDMADGLLSKTKAQYAESQSWGRSLYIIVLGCQSKYKKYYQHVIIEASRFWRDAIVLTPSQAASLWKACESPLTKHQVSQLLTERTWPRFFSDINQEKRQGQFLGVWPSLKPTDRFVIPQEWGAIKASVEASPLTIIVGPPSVGKTFAAVNLLYERYREGHSVAWFAPNEGDMPSEPIPIRTSDKGMTRSIEHALKQIGLSPEREANDKYDAISALLKDSAWVFIEDPFGASDDDFKASLHSYDLFDLSEFVNAISTGGKRAGCRLILTSREGLFEKWQRELEEQNLPIPEMSVISITPQSYHEVRENPADEQKVHLAATLLKVNGNIDSTSYDDSGAYSNEGFTLAQSLADLAATPREVELLTLLLPKPAVLDDLRKARTKLQSNWTSLTQDLCRTSTDPERLFLFLICAQRTLWYKNRDFSKHYSLLYKALNLSGDPLENENLARRRFWGLYYTLPVHRSKWPPRRARKKSSPEATALSEASSESMTLSSKESDKLWKRILEVEDIPGRTDVLPVHSSVHEAIRRELATHGDFLTRVALSLFTITEGGDEANEQEEEDINVNQLQYEIFLYLMSFSRLLSNEAALALADLLPKGFGTYPVLYGQVFSSSLLHNWSDLPTVIRDRFFSLVKDSHFDKTEEKQVNKLGALTLCGYLASHEDFPADEAWKFYQLLIDDVTERGTLYRGGILSNPWEYFILHLTKVPTHLRLPFDLAAYSEGIATATEQIEPTLPAEIKVLIDHDATHMRQQAQISQRAVIYMLGRLYAQYWKEFPPAWQQLVFTETVRASSEVIEEIYWGMQLPLRSRTCPECLIALLREQLNHADAHVRASATMFNLLYRSNLPKENEAAVTQWFLTESDWDSVKRLYHETEVEKSHPDILFLLTQRLSSEDHGFNNLPEYEAS